RSPFNSWHRSGPDFGGQKSASDSAARRPPNLRAIFFAMSTPYERRQAASSSRSHLKLSLTNMSMRSLRGNSCLYQIRYPYGNILTKITQKKSFWSQV